MIFRGFLEGSLVFFRERKWWREEGGGRPWHRAGEGEDNKEGEKLVG